MKKNNSILFTVGVHGDEHSPVKVVQSKMPARNYLICHKLALEKNIRYLERDLNRSFPGKINGTLEEQLAFNLIPYIRQYQFIVDIHTATCSTPPFIILTKTSPAHVKLAAQTGLRHIVIMNRQFGAGKSLVDFVTTGISIESGRENSTKTESIISSILDKIQNKSYRKTSFVFYQVSRTLLKNDSNEFLVRDIKSFKLVSAGKQVTNSGRKFNFDFYPILARSRNYPNFLCLMANKINVKI